MVDPAESHESEDRARLLAIDDKPNMLKLVERILSPRFDVTTCSQPALAPDLLRHHEFDIVLSDVRMPNLSGMDILRLAKSEYPQAEVILMTAYGDIAQAVKAMREGAYDYITKPFEPDELLRTVANAVAHRRLLRPTRLSLDELRERYSYHDIIGNSLPMQRALALLRKATETDTTVLLLGESGTGKELFAHAIHAGSRRGKARFVPVNCGAIPRDLIESELFGHLKGAFTTAVRSNKGLFEEAHRGTVFLDEIGELDLDLQIKINRVIQEREIRAVGDTQDRKVDVRIVAATNRDLSESVKQGSFREDLYYRLRVFPIWIPPLRERGEDIALLASYCLQRFSHREKKRIETIAPAALKALLAHEWPGNVRELENTIERAVLLEESPQLSAAVVCESLDRSRSTVTASALPALPYREAMELAQDKALREYVSALLRDESGNVTRAAKRAGIERESFHRLMRRCGLRSADFKEGAT